MTIDREGIARLIPHHGDMCLLDAVLRWDAAAISCTTDSHRRAHHPLARDGRLGILVGVEYAAQAMAIHGALHGALQGARSPGGTRPARAGYLASVRSLTWTTGRLDLCAGPLVVDAERIHGESSRVIYAFALRHAGATLLEGRAAVVLEDIAA